MTMNTFKQWVADQMSAYPNLKEEILDFYYLAKGEIAEGGSEMHEISLAMSSINELIGDANEPQVGWDVAKNHAHDISGILNHEEYWYKKENGIYYPQLRKS